MTDLQKERDPFSEAQDEYLRDVMGVTEEGMRKLEEESKKRRSEQPAIDAERDERAREG